MAVEFIVSPEGLQKLEACGLGERIREKARGLPHSSLYSLNEVEDKVTWMEKNGYFQNIPEELVRIRQLIEDLFEHRGEPHWAVARPTGNVSHEKVEAHNISVVAGCCYASDFLQPAEFGQFHERGFNSHTDYVGTVDTYIQETKRKMSIYRQGHKWESDWKGERFVTHVTGRDHLDPEITRTNITPMQAKDPFGNDASYRPITREDSQGIYPAQNTEPSILGALLRYAQQENLDCPLLRNQAADFLTQVRDWKEYLGQGDTLTTGMVVQDIVDRPLVTPDIERPLYWCIARGSQNAYAMHLDKERNLAVSHMAQKEYKIVGEPRLIIPPHDINDMIHGCFVQANKGLGRTSLQELIDILEGSFHNA